jgi:hypothetical protein
MLLMEKIAFGLSHKYLKRKQMNRIFILFAPCNVILQKIKLIDRSAAKSGGIEDYVGNLDARCRYNFTF